jgi:hypothetical protein
MSVRINVVVIVEDGITIEDLKKWVHEEDEILSGEGNGIAVENVKEEDVLQQLFAGAIQYEVVHGTMEEL